MSRPAPDLLGAPVIPLILRLSGPAILGISAHSLQMLANAWFVADLGPTAIATIAIAYPVTLLVAALGYGAGIGAASLVSRALGRGDRRSAEDAAALGFWLVGPAGLVLTLAILADAPAWLRLLGAGPGLAEAASAYTALSTAGTALMLVMIVGGFVVRAQGLAALSGAVMVAAFGLNILLDAVLILGFGLGTAGAGWAALLSQLAGALAYAWHFATVRGDARIRFRAPWRMAAPRLLLGDLLRIGAPVTASSLLAAFAMALFVRAGAAYGEAAVAGLGIALRLVMVAALPLLGVMAGAQAVIGFGHGAGRPDRVARALRFLVGASLAYGLAVGGLMILCAEPLVGLVADDAATRAATVPTLVVFAAAFMPVGLQLTAATLFQAVGAPRRAALVSLSAQGLALIPPLLVLPQLYGFDGVLASRAVAETLANGLGAVLLLASLREGAIALDGGPAAFVPAADQPAHEGA
ncbi:MATE family efflux transporter [Methylobacterium sp. A54F]